MPVVEEQAVYNVPLDESVQLYIVELCKEKQISPELVLAMIEQESRYNIDIVGDNGNSLGLMQIQPRWHKDRMDRLGCDNLLNPYENVTVGVDILLELFEKYDGDVYMVLMAYNGGPSYAQKMMNKGKISDYALSVTSRAEELEGEKKYELKM